MNRRGTASEAAAAKVPVIVYVPADLLRRLREITVRDATSYGAWFLDRFDEFYDELATIYQPPAERRSPLPPRRRESRRRVDTPTQLQLRITGDELAVIDQRMAELGAPSRSEFVTAVIKLGVQADS